MRQFERQHLIEFRGRLEFCRREKGRTLFCLLPIPIRKEIFSFLCIHFPILTSFQTFITSQLPYCVRMISGFLPLVCMYTHAPHSVPHHQLNLN